MLGDAREARRANEPRLAAEAYARALTFAREVYAAGEPGAARTMKVPALPTVKLTLSALVMVGGEMTRSWKAWVANGLMPSSAVMVTA